MVADPGEPLGVPRAQDGGSSWGAQGRFQSPQMFLGSVRGVPRWGANPAGEDDTEVVMGKLLFGVLGIRGIFQSGSSLSGSVCGLSSCPAWVPHPSCPRSQEGHPACPSSPGEHAPGRAAQDKSGITDAGAPRAHPGQPRDPALPVGPVRADASGPVQSRPDSVGPESRNSWQVPGEAWQDRESLDAEPAVLV